MVVLCFLFCLTLLSGKPDICVVNTFFDKKKTRSLLSKVQVYITRVSQMIPHRHVAIKLIFFLLYPSR